MDHAYAHGSYVQRTSENVAAWLVSEQVYVAMTNVNSMWIAEFSANETAGSKRKPTRYRLLDKHPLAVYRAFPKLLSVPIKDE